LAVWLSVPLPSVQVPPRTVHSEPRVFVVNLSLHMGQVLGLGPQGGVGPDHAPGLSRAPARPIRRLDEHVRTRSRIGRMLHGCIDVLVRCKLRAARWTAPLRLYRRRGPEHCDGMYTRPTRGRRRRGVATVAFAIMTNA